MALKKAILAAALCTGFLAAFPLFSLIGFIQTESLAAASDFQKAAPMDKGPHVLPPF
ncbi:hypothetical protein [Planomicrobium sp. CPCC 101110]|uniref:hypothetical protein n=1 Tax=Planomicrobium sp. CPCC 101110 TaxID=2599619 RepID=UPI001647A928|nr:hypothetical protein [Planomicrobium sp. CPCC 101110]